MKNYFLNFILLIIISCITHQLTNAQISQNQILESDSVITSSYELKLEILKLRKKVGSLEGQIRKMKGNINGLTDKVQDLKYKNEKSADEYKQMEEYAMRILEQNDSMNMANRDLIAINLELEDSKESIEIAASALSDVLKKERNNFTMKMASFKKNISKGCTDISHSTRKGMVSLDEENVHKLSWVDDLSLTVNTCYALPREEASNNVKVYFSLYRKDDSSQNYPLESNIPIILTPDRDVSDEAVIFYNGTLDLALPKKNKSMLKTSFVYQVEFEEEIIASGGFRLD